MSVESMAAAASGMNIAGPFMFGVLTSLITAPGLLIRCINPYKDSITPTLTVCPPLELHLMLVRPKPAATSDELVNSSNMPPQQPATLDAEGFHNCDAFRSKTYRSGDAFVIGNLTTDTGAKMECSFVCSIGEWVGPLCRVQSVASSGSVSNGEADGSQQAVSFDIDKFQAVSLSCEFSTRQYPNVSVFSEGKNITYTPVESLIYDAIVGRNDDERLGTVGISNGTTLRFRCHNIVDYDFSGCIKAQCINGQVKCLRKDPKSIELYGGEGLTGEHQYYPTASTKAGNGKNNNNWNDFEPPVCRPIEEPPENLKALKLGLVSDDIPKIGYQADTGVAAPSEDGRLFVYPGSRLILACRWPMEGQTVPQWSYRVPNATAIKTTGWRKNMKIKGSEWRITIDAIEPGQSGLYTCTSPRGRNNSLVVAVRAVDCPLPWESQHLLLQRGSTRFSAVATFNCTEGYKLTGDASNECLVNGEWSNPLPYCEPIFCREPEPHDEHLHIMLPRGVSSTHRRHHYESGGGAASTMPLLFGDRQKLPYDARTSSQHGLQPTTGRVGSSYEPVTISTVPFGTKAEFACTFSHRLEPDVRAAVCSHTGDWLPVEFPRCVPIICTQPSEPDNGHILNKQRQYMAGDWIHYACKPGYGAVGRTYANCTHTGVWSNPPPRCDVHCVYPGPLENGYINPIRTSYKVQEHAAFECFEGYRLKGDTVAWCSEDGIWSSSLPACIPSNI